MTILPNDESSVRRYIQLKAQLEQMGEVISDLDLQIANIALDQDEVFVTHNQKHSARPTNLAGLILEDCMT